MRVWICGLEKGFLLIVTQCYECNVVFLVRADICLFLLQQTFILASMVRGSLSPKVYLRFSLCLKRRYADNLLSALRYARSFPVYVFVIRK